MTKKTQELLIEMSISTAINIQHNGCEQQTLPSSVMLGTVTRVGYYGDTLPKLVITVKKNDSLPIPFQDGERVPFPFIVNGKCFTAGIRTTNRSATVMISPDLNDTDSNPVRLTDLLYDLGWVDKKSRIQLRIEDGVLKFC
jgi:hypothetical protein